VCALISALAIVPTDGHAATCDTGVKSQAPATSVATVFGIAGLIDRELTTEDPVVDLRVLRRPSLAIGCALGLLMGLGYQIVAMGVCRQSD